MAPSIVVGWTLAALLASASPSVGRASAIAGDGARTADVAGDPGTEAASRSETSKSIDALVAPFAEKGLFSGVVLVAEQGKIVYERAFGRASVELGVPLATDSRIGIASITKSMTAIVLFRLVEEKKIALADSVSRFLPEFPNGDAITIEMLANHRAGIPHRVLAPELEAVPHTSAEMVDRIAEAEPLFAPGARRTYSSAGYALLARVLEIAAGRTFPQLLQRYVFDPAGMADSVEFDSERPIARRAQEYLLRPEGWIDAPLKDYSFLIGAGSVYSTARDVYRFGRAVLDGVYGEKIRSELVREEVFRSSGRTNGHRAYVLIDGAKGSGYVLLSNLSSGAFDILTTDLSDLLAGREPSIPKFEVPELAEIPARKLADYVGTYDRADGGRFEIGLDDRGLHSGDIRIYPVGGDCFFDYSFFGDVCFSRDATGQPSKIVWKGAGYELVGERNREPDAKRAVTRPDS